MNKIQAIVLGCSTWLSKKTLKKLIIIEKCNKESLWSQGISFLKSVLLRVIGERGKKVVTRDTPLSNLSFYLIQFDKNWDTEYIYVECLLYICFRRWRFVKRRLIAIKTTPQFVLLWNIFFFIVFPFQTLPLLEVKGYVIYKSLLLAWYISDSNFPPNISPSKI